MFEFQSDLTKRVLRLVLFCCMTLTNVFIVILACSSLLFELLSLGLERYVSLGVAILAAIGFHIYIMTNHKIQEFIETKENINEQ